jgi:hypothetical protein
MITFEDEKRCLSRSASHACVHVERFGFGV